jgi:excisionase family DNA binding protein
MTNNSTAEEVLTISEEAAYLKVTERTIYRLAGTKKIPAFKVGGVWRFARTDIDLWIKQQSMEGLGANFDRDNHINGQSNDGEHK